MNSGEKSGRIKRRHLALIKGVRLHTWPELSDGECARREPRPAPALKLVRSESESKVPEPVPAEDLPLWRQRYEGAVPAQSHLVNVTA